MLFHRVCSIKLSWVERRAPISASSLCQLCCKWAFLAAGQARVCGLQFLGLPGDHPVDCPVCVWQSHSALIILQTCLLNGRDMFPLVSEGKYQSILRTGNSLEYICCNKSCSVAHWWRASVLLKKFLFKILWRRHWGHGGGRDIWGMRGARSPGSAAI